MKEKNKKVGIIKSLVSLVGVTAGIVISAIGGIMFLESMFKIYVFDIQEGRYNNYIYKCDKYDVDSIEAKRLIGGGDIFPLEINPISKNEEKIKKLTKDEKEFLKSKYNECKKEAKEDAYKSFLNREKMNIATGLAFILVGLPLLYFYQRRRREK